MRLTTLGESDQVTCSTDVHSWWETSRPLALPSCNYSICKPDLDQIALGEDSFKQRSGLQGSFSCRKVLCKVGHKATLPEVARWVGWSCYSSFLLGGSLLLTRMEGAKEVVGRLTSACARYTTHKLKVDKHHFCLLLPPNTTQTHLSLG